MKQIALEMIARDIASDLSRRDHPIPDNATVLATLQRAQTYIAQWLRESASFGDTTDTVTQELLRAADLIERGEWTDISR